MRTRGSVLTPSLCNVMTNDLTPRARNVLMCTYNYGGITDIYYGVLHVSMVLYIPPHGRRRNAEGKSVHKNRLPDTDGNRKIGCAGAVHEIRECRANRANPQYCRYWNGMPQLYMRYGNVVQTGQIPNTVGIGTICPVVGFTETIVPTATCTTR